MGIHAPMARRDKLALVMIPILALALMLGVGAASISSTAYPDGGGGFNPQMTVLPLTQGHFNLFGDSDAAPEEADAAPPEDAPVPPARKRHKRHKHHRTEGYDPGPLPGALDPLPPISEPVALPPILAPTLPAPPVPRPTLRPAPACDVADATDEDDEATGGNGRKLLALGFAVIALLIAWGVVARYRLATQIKGFAKRAEDAAAIAAAALVAKVEGKTCA